MIVLKVIFWVSLVALVWTHVLYPLFIAALARLRPRPCARDASFPAARRARDRGLQRGRRDRGQARERARAGLPARAPAHRRGLGRLERRAPTRSCASFADRGVELVRAPRGGKVNAQNHAVRTLGDVDVVAFSDANCEWRPGRARPAGRAARRPARRLRLRPAAAALARGHEPGGRLLALRDLAARARVARALGHGRQRLHLRACGASATRRSTRASATTSRSRISWSSAATAPSTRRARSRSRR